MDGPLYKMPSAGRRGLAQEHAYSFHVHEKKKLPRIRNVAKSHLPLKKKKFYDSQRPSVGIITTLRFGRMSVLRAFLA